MIRLRYDCQAAFEAGVNRHPQEEWELLGITPVQVDADPFFDHWILCCTPESLDGIVMPPFITPLTEREVGLFYPADIIENAVK